MQFDLALLVSSVVLSVGCVTSADNAVTITLDSDFQLQVGESAIAPSEDLEIGLITVSSDSRCGKGEVCIWEGDATVRIWLQRAGDAREERELHTAAREARTASYAGYSIRLVTLMPPAISGRSIAAADYVATFELVRGNSADSDNYQ